MRKPLLTIVFVTFSYCSLAQGNKAEVEILQSVFGMEKKSVAAKFIKLEGAAKDAFWKAYDEYENERIDLGKKRVALLEKYTSNYRTLDDKSTDEIVNEMIVLQGETDKLIVTYYKKIKKEAGVKPAAQFYQLEGYVLSKIRSEIMENIPVIGELDK
jgi:hypothetical protein